GGEAAGRAGRVRPGREPPDDSGRLGTAAGQGSGPPRHGGPRVIHPVIRSARAEADLEEIAEYLAQHSLRTALRFLDAAEKAFALLAKVPEIGGRYESDNPALADLRVWAVPGFRRHWIFYRHLDQRVQVARVLYASRDLEPLLGD